MLRILPQKPLEVVSVQAAAGSIIHKAMRVFYQSRKVELEEYRATSMLLWEYTEMEWEHGPFSAARGVGGGEGALDIKQEQMERSTIPETTLYIKRGQMERDLLLCMKRRERRERKKKSSRESDVSTIESANDPCKLPVKVTKVWQSWCNVPDYSRKFIRGTGWVSVKLQAWKVQVLRHNWQPCRNRTARVQLLTCAAAAYTFKRELKHERRARAFVRAAELHAQLGDNGSHAQAIARSCQQIVRAEGMHASARRLIALAKEGASSKMRRLAEWVEEQHGGDCDGGEGVEKIR